MNSLSGFYPVIKMVVKQMGFPKAEPQDVYDGYAQNLLDHIKSRFSPEEQEEYEIFEPVIRPILYQAFHDKRFLAEAFTQITYALDDHGVSQI